MIRYDLIGRKENGYAMASVEEHVSGCFVRYDDAMNRIAELEGCLAEYRKITQELYSTSKELSMIEYIAACLLEKGKM